MLIAAYLLDKRQLLRYAAVVNGFDGHCHCAGGLQSAYKTMQRMIAIRHSESHLQLCEHKRSAHIADVHM